MGINYYILAGNRKEYMEIVLRNKWTISECKYVDCACNLKHVKGKNLYCYGSYQSHHSYNLIIERAKNNGFNLIYI